MKRTTFFVLALLFIATGLLHYGPTVALPLFLDDASNFRWLTPTDGLDVWITAGGFPFYRPLPFTLFKLLWQLQGGYHAPTLHALVVAIHLINALLVGLLAAQVQRDPHTRPLAGLMAAWLMLLFPFSYQAVALVGSIFHLTLVTGAVGAAILGVYYLQTQQNWALVGAWIAAFCGTFSHENGVMIPALVGLTSLAAIWGDTFVAPTGNRPRGDNLLHMINQRRRDLSMLLGPMLFIAAGYFLLWLLVPKANDASGLLLADLDAKIAYFAQGLVYPLSALVRPLFADEPAVIPVTLLLAVVGVGAALVALWRARRAPGATHVSAQPGQNASINSLAGLAWVGLAAVPSVLLLTPDYLLGGPRLLYLSSVGVALFWTVWVFGFLTRLHQQQSRRTLQIASLACGLGFIVLISHSGSFVAQRIHDYARLGAYYDDVITAAVTEPDTPTLFVNAPMFVAPERGTYLVGAEGATYLLDFITLQDVVWVNTGIDTDIQTVAFGNTLVETGEVFAPRGPFVDWDGLDTALAEAARVFTTQFSPEHVRSENGYPDTFWLAEAGRRANEMSGEVDAAYDFVRLNLDYRRAPPALALTWTVEQPFTGTVFVHALCGSEVVAQFDGAPLGGLHPFDRWQRDETWIDLRPLVGVPCDPLDDLRVGLYDPATLARFPARLPDGSTTDTLAVFDLE